MELDELPDAEENYHESSDEDFNPANAQADESSTSSDEEEAPAKQSQQRRKRKAKAAAPEELDSGDEVTIEAARKRRKRKKKGGRDEEDDDDLLLSDDGRDGGLIKTRAQRRIEHKERKPLARIDGATVDVDALWAQMSAAPLEPLYPTAPTTAQAADSSKDQDGAVGGVAAASVFPDETDLVSVRKVYTFAGQRTIEEKDIPRSALSQYLSDGWKTVDPAVKDTSKSEEKEADVEAADAAPKVRRPLRRPSRFDPNPTGYVRALPPEHQLSWPRRSTATARSGQENVPALEVPRASRQEKAQKLNVVEKSRHDWTGFVDKEGIAEELDEHGKTKEAYLGRMQFLAGVEAKQEEGRRRLKTAALS